jgi:hypothetical protein
MLALDKETVLSLLDKEAEDYDSSLVAINLLPADSIFEVVIEEIITAEYFDEKQQEHYIFKLSYDYYSSNTPIDGVHKRSLEASIKSSLDEQKEMSINPKKRPHSTLTKVLMAITVSVAIGYNVYMVYFHFL